MPDQGDCEEAAALDRRAVIGLLARREVPGARWHALADLVVDVLELAEERVAVRGEDMIGPPDRQMAARPEQSPGLPVPDSGVDPVPCCRREDEVEMLQAGWLPVLECLPADLHERILSQIAPGGCRKSASGL